MLDVFATMNARKKGTRGSIKMENKEINPRCPNKEDVSKGKYQRIHTETGGGE